MNTNTLAVETDTRLADLNQQAAEIHHTISVNTTTIKQYAGFKRTRHGYAGTLEEAEAIIGAAGFEPASPVASWGRPGSTVDIARARIAAAKTKRNAVNAEIARCEDTWNTNGRWSRFFIVQGGHIHRSTDCSTCNNGHEPTSFGWLPELSGLTEADAVAAHGPLLCTICSPSAPVEWTNGHEIEAAAKRAGACPGSRQYVETSDWRARYAKCPECGTVQARTSTGKLRAHKP